MRTWRFLTYLIFIALFIGAAGCAGQDNSSQQIIEASKDAITLKVSGNGNLEITDDARLAFTSGGKIESIYAARGGTVTRGMLLAELDTGSLELALVQAQSSVAQIKYELIKLQDTPSAEDIEAAEAAVTAAELYLEYVQDNRKALEDALKIAQENYRMAKLFSYQTAIDSAQANLSQALAAISGNEADRANGEAKLKSARAQLAKLQEPPDQDAIAAANTRLAAAEKAAADIQRQISEAVIISTMDGVVAQEVTANEGDIVAAGMSIFYIIDPSQMELVIDVDELDISQVAVGQNAAISFDALTATELEGKVSYISPLPTTTGGIIIYKVTINITVPEGVNLKNGMSATAEIVLQKETDVIVLPNRAITEDSNGNSTVQVKTETGTETRQIVTGITDGFYTEIVKGLNAGEKIIIPKTTTEYSIFGG